LICVHGAVVCVEPELHQEVEVVALVQHFDVDVRMELAEAADLGVLLGHQLLVERGDLDVEVVGREIEVRPESSPRVAVVIPLEGELARFVLPGDAVEVEQVGELALRGMGEANRLVEQR
jgi:hypothetical protein